MAYSAPSTRSTSDLITASIWNSDVVANPIAIYAGAMSVTSQAVGDILYASSTTQLGRIAAVATGQVLTSAGTGTVPAWSSNVDLGGTLDVTGATTLDSTLGVVGAVTFNDAGADVDIRFESDDDANMFFMDGSTDRIGIGTNAPDSTLTVAGHGGYDTQSTLKVDRSPGGGAYSSTGAAGIVSIGSHTGSTNNNHTQAAVRFQHNNTDKWALGMTGQAGAATSEFSLHNMTLDSVPFWIDSSSNVTFNEPGIDADFRVESDDDTHCLFVDASTDRVGIGTNAPTNALTIVGAGALSTGTEVMIDRSLGGGAYGSTGANAIVFINSHTGSTNNNHTEASIRFSNDNTLKWQIGMLGQAGSALTDFEIRNPVLDKTAILVDTNSHIIFNEEGIDADFRVEGDTNTHALFLEAQTNRVGIGTTGGAPAGALHVQATDVMPLILQRDTASNGLGVGIEFRLGDSASASAGHSYGQVLVVINDNTNGGEDGNFFINLSDDGTLTENVRCLGASGNWKFCGNGHGLFGIGEVPFEATFSVHSTANVSAAHIRQTIGGEYGLIVRGGGTSSTPVLDCRNSSNTQTFTVTDAGALSKASGSFRIPHPHPSKADTHDLVHSFVESNRAGLVYDGEVDLVAGSATIDMDELVGMTSGTWVLLTRDPHVFTSNETGWSPVRGIVSGATLTIECEDNTSTDTVSYMVVAERQDAHMINEDTDWTDDEGRPIIAPLRRTAPSPSSSASASLSPSASASPSE